jgi:hypothetical protein
LISLKRASMSLEEFFMDLMKQRGIANSVWVGSWELEEVISNK